MAKSTRTAKLARSGRLRKRADKLLATGRESDRLCALDLLAEARRLAQEVKEECEAIYPWLKFVNGRDLPRA